MNSQDFLQEVKRSGVEPERFESKYKEFQQYQELSLNTLKEFHYVCEKNGIHYQLAYGSLLGAIRDGGQIPWDYDVDVFVPICDKDDLIKALKNDLNCNYYFYCPETDNKCRHYMMRVAPKGYRTEAMHVDVFYVIGAPDKKSKAFGKKCKKVFQKRYDKLVNIREESFGSKTHFCRLVLGRISNAFITIKQLDRAFLRLTNQYDFWESKFSISFDDESCKYLYETQKMWDTSLISLSCGTFRVPKEYDYVLREIYGDYNSIPPLKNRLIEIERAMFKFNYYR